MQNHFTLPLSERSSHTIALIGLCLAAGVAIGFTSAIVNPLILLAAAPAVAIGVWALRSDERSLWLLIAVIGLLPRFAMPIKFVLTPTFLDMVLLLLGIAWFLKITQRPLRLREVSITLPLLGLVTVAIVTFVIGLPNGPLTPLVLRRFTELLLSLILVFVLIAILRQPHALLHVVRVFILLGALSAVVGIILYVIPGDLAIRLLSALRVFGYPDGPGVLHFINDDPSLMQRATGLWIDPNAYGGYLLMCGIVTMPQLFSRKPVLPRGITLVALGAISMALILTVSRGAMLGFVFVAALIGAVRYRRLLILVIFVVCMALVLPQTRDLVSHFAAGFAGQDLATQMRMGEYKDAVSLIQRYPLLGVGFADTPDVDLYIGVSSMYLLIAEQMGLLGVTAFAITVVTLYASAFRAWRRIWPDEERCAIWLGAFGAITGALISGVFDHYFFNIDFHNSVMLLWLVVAIAVASQIGDGRHVGAGHEAPGVAADVVHSVDHA